MASGFKHRVLVVDDEESVLETSREILKLQGYEVRTARDGFEALIELRGAVSDVVVTQPQRVERVLPGSERRPRVFPS